MPVMIVATRIACAVWLRYSRNTIVLASTKPNAVVTASWGTNGATCAVPRTDRSTTIA